jgi:hypothetical protein
VRPVHEKRVCHQAPVTQPARLLEHGLAVLEAVHGVPPVVRPYAAVAHTPERQRRVPGWQGPGEEDRAFGQVAEWELDSLGRMAMLTRGWDVETRGWNGDDTGGLQYEHSLRSPGNLNGGRQFLVIRRSNRHMLPLYGKSDRLFTQGPKFETR